MFVTSNTQSTLKKKNYFTKEEDERIKELVRVYGKNRWDLISQSLEKRTPKQIRQRWINHLDPSIRKRCFTLEEDRLLLKKYKEFGPRWTLISKFFEGRSENAIKNRFYQKLTMKYKYKYTKYNRHYKSPNETNSSNSSDDEKFFLPPLEESFPFPDNFNIPDVFPFNLKF